MTTHNKRTIEIKPAWGLVVLAAVLGLFLVAGRASADEYADAVATVKSEALGPKIAPHYELFNSFPVEVIVEYRVDKKDGKARHIKGAKRLRDKQKNAHVKMQPDNLPYSVLVIDSAEDLLNLLRDSDVVSVAPNEKLTISSGQISDMREAAGMADAWGLGAGIGVAMIDTGVRSYEATCTKDSSGKYKLSTKRTTISYRIVRKWSIGPDVAYTCWHSDEDHGTIMAEIVVGMAPEAIIGMYRVGGDDAGMTTANVIAAVSQIIEDKDAYNYKLVSMSLNGATKYTGACYTPLANIAQSLDDEGIQLVASAGNNGWQDGLAEPACHPKALSVGNWWYSSGQLKFDGTGGNTGNRGPTLSLAAPGCHVSTASTSKANPSYVWTCGTSQAAASVAGAAAVLLGQWGVDAPTTALRAVIAGGWNQIIIDVFGSKRPKYHITSFGSAWNLAKTYLEESTARPQPVAPKVQYSRYANVPCGSNLEGSKPCIM